MLNANGQTYDSLRRYSQTLDLDGIAVRTVNLEGLLHPTDACLLE
jgi:hypothetical protein